MRIPMTQIQAASISALPQQALRETRSASPAAPADAGQMELITEKLAASTETGDRDAQEQYQGPIPRKKNSNDEISSLGNSQSTSFPDAIWNLSVADDQPPSDLDIRG